MLLRNLASAPPPPPFPPVPDIQLNDYVLTPRGTKSRKKKRLTRPKLWEVDAVDMCWDLERKFEALEVCPAETRCDRAAIDRCSEPRHLPIQPVALELQAAPKTTPASSPVAATRQSGWYVNSLFVTSDRTDKGFCARRAPWFSRGHKPQPMEMEEKEKDETPVARKAQLMFLVAMPTAARDAEWPEREYAIATQTLPYTPPIPPPSPLEHDLY